VRSEIRLLSNSASTPIICNMSRPVGRGGVGCLGERIEFDATGAALGRCPE
jgi:hypothetical protein